MTSSRAREFAALLVGFGTALSGCVITRSELEGLDAFTTEDAGRDARIADDVRGDGEVDVGRDVGSDVGSDASLDAHIVPLSDLIAHWEFANMATLLRDSTANGHDLMVLGTVSPGARSNMMELEFRSSPGLMTPDAPDLDQVTAVSLWAQPTPAPTAPITYAILQSTGRLSITYGAESGDNWQYRCTDGVATVASARTLADWSHVACVVRAGALELYVNGVMVPTVPTAPGADSTSGYFLGAYPDRTSTAFVMNGRMDDVRLWRVAPTATEIHDDFMATMGSH